MTVLGRGKGVAPEINADEGEHFEPQRMPTCWSVFLSSRDTADVLLSFRTNSPNIVREEHVTCFLVPAVACQSNIISGCCGNKSAKKTECTPWY